MNGMLVTAKMAEPVVYYDDGLHLDGILAWAAYLDLTEDERWGLPPITDDWATDFDLPLQRWHVDVVAMDARLRGDEGVWGWCATQVLSGWLRRGSHEIRKKPAAEKMARHTASPSVNLGTGPGKAYNLIVPTAFAHELHWAAIGDMKEALRLLSTHVQGVGKHCARGMGRVLHWSIRQVDVSTEDILKNRVMPCSERQATCIRAIRPPYHHGSRHTWAREPCH